MKKYTNFLNLLFPSLILLGMIYGLSLLIITEEVEKPKYTIIDIDGNKYLTNEYRTSGMACIYFEEELEDRVEGHNLCGVKDIIDNNTGEIIMKRSIR